MPQPPYSLDLAPCDFFVFPKLKRPMNSESKNELMAIPKSAFSRIGKSVLYPAQIGKSFVAIGNRDGNSDGYSDGYSDDDSNGDSDGDSDIDSVLDLSQRRVR
ncbi:hypothetical protein ACLKA7_011620 [Drosophila subpalustris]